MNKSSVIVGGILILLIILFYYDSPKEVTIQKNDTYLTEIRKIESDLYHWNHMPLTYSYSNIEECYPLRINRTEYALREIERLTNNTVRFVKTSEKADISFICTRESNIGLNIETLGEAETEYDDYTKEIKKSTIYLYGGIQAVDINTKKDCSYPDTEMHEILHAMGEEHTIHTKSVMNVLQQSCLQEINLDVDRVIFDRLKKIYAP